METIAPFKALQDLQNEQREGWMPAKSDTPETNEREALSEGLHDEWCFSFCRKLERERDEALAAITDLTQRLQDRQESFQAQLIRIEDTWREKLSEVTKEKNQALLLLSNIINSGAEGSQQDYNDAETILKKHSVVTKA